MTVVLPSGMRSILRMRARVPIRCRSSGPGSSTEMSRWDMTPMVLVLLLASRIRRMDLSRPTVMGMTTPGKRTVLRSGRMGTGFW